MNAEKQTHECIIGSLWQRGLPSLVTLSQLNKRIADDFELIEWGKNSPEYHMIKDMLPRGYTLRDYGDLRRNVGLRHFRFCPECGAAIDWRCIREG